MIEVRYNLNMVPDKGSPIHINVSQNDDKCRTFIFKLYSSDGSWTAPASATSTIEGRKDDGKFFSFACTYSNGEVTVIVQQQMVAVAGKVRCKIKLVSGAETIESAPFYFVVNPKSMPVNADMSKSDVVDAVAKATQKIVDQVAGSIPQDYVKLNEDVSGLKSDLEDIDYIVFKDKINKLTFNSEGSSINIVLNGNTITSIDATKEQYKAFINTSLFENGKKYIVVMKFKNDSSTNITVYANAFSYAFQGSIGKTQSLGIGKSETSVMSYTAKSDIRGFSIYSTTENASYTVDIYIYDVTDKDTSNIDFSIGGTKIKILKSDLEKPYFGKILCTYGDSITAQQTWQDYVQRELGFSKYYNHGVGGRRLMAMATDECLSEITEDFDVMLVMGGTNDWAQDRTVGTEADINTDEQTFTGTFYGGLNTLIKKILVKYPTKRIVFMTQTPVKNSNGEAFFNKKGSADGLKNSNGNTTRDFARATLNACGNNHVPCVDLNSLVGWNENNISSFVKNENDTFFHPTSVGGKRIAECISGFLKSLQSIN